MLDVSGGTYSRVEAFDPPSTIEASLLGSRCEESAKDKTAEAQRPCISDVNGHTCVLADIGVYITTNIDSHAPVTKQDNEADFEKQEKASRWGTTQQDQTIITAIQRNNNRVKSNLPCIPEEDAARQDIHSTSRMYERHRRQPSDPDSWSGISFEEEMSACANRVHAALAHNGGEDWDANGDEGENDQKPLEHNLQNLSALGAYGFDVERGMETPRADAATAACVRAGHDRHTEAVAGVFQARCPTQMQPVNDIHAPSSASPSSIELLRRVEQRSDMAVSPSSIELLRRVEQRSDMAVCAAAPPPLQSPSSAKPNRRVIHSYALSPNSFDTPSPSSLEMRRLVEQRAPSTLYTLPQQPMGSWHHSLVGQYLRL